MGALRGIAREETADPFAHQVVLLAKQGASLLQYDGVQQLLADQRVDKLTVFLSRRSKLGYCQIVRLQEVRNGRF